MVTSTKFDVEKFDGTNNFGMWQCEVQDVLFQQELDVALEESRPEDVDEKDWARINRLACGTIRLCLSKELKYPFMRETSASKLWKEMEDKFKKKSIENKLYTRTKLYRFQYKPDNQPCMIAGIGSISLKNHDASTRVLTDVRYIPKLEKNLISLGTLESKGFTIILQNGILKVVSGALVVMKGIRRNNLYLYQGSPAVGTAAAVSEVDKVAEMSRLWHMRLGHAGEKSLQTLVMQGLLKGAKTFKLDFCEQCVLGKQKRVKFGTAIHNTEGILDYIHTDIWGPTKTASLGGKHYFVTFVDDFSRRVWVYMLISKDEVFETFLVWKKMVENQTGRKIKVLRSDNGTEYRNDQFSYFCKKEGISLHFTVRDTPQQNGVAERMNRTLLEKVLG